MWMLIGLSLFAIIRFRTNFHLRLLLAPVFGLAINIVALFTLSRIGFPIKTVALPLFLVGILLAGYFLFTQRVTWKRRAFNWFCFFILIAIIPFAWSLLKYGFEWLAFVSGDMTYYTTSSTRLLDYGYSELPVSGNIYDLKDHSLLTWHFHNEMSYRTGADLCLAYLVGLTGLTAHQVYMPLIIALNSCVVAGAGALSLLGVRKWSFALWTMVLVALSPMLALEVTQQQMGQAIGLALLTGLCVSYAKVTVGHHVLPWMIYSVLSFSSLAISYFEIIPFFALYVLVFEATRWKKWKDATIRIAYLRTIAVMACGILLLLNNYIFKTVERIIGAATISFQSSAMTMQADGMSLFPHFFIPSNGALLWGWVPLSASGHAASLVVVLGLLATFLFTGWLFTSRIRLLPSAQMTIVMLAVALVMRVSGNGYGLFKIAMFIQPFLLATLVAMVALLVTRRLFQRLGLVFFGLSFIPALQENIARVSGDIGSSQVAYASTAQLGRQLRELQYKLQTQPTIKVFSDTPSITFFALQAHYFKGIIFDSLVIPLPVLKSIGELNKFVFSPGTDGDVVDFRSKKHTGNTDEYLLTTTGEFSVVNRGHSGQGFLLQFNPLGKLTNHLLLRTSTTGAGSLNSDVSLHKLERDPSFPGGTMSAVGQYQVYEILGAIEGSRAQLSLSASYNKTEEFRLPAIRVVGAEGVSLPLVGRGSARLISSPITPRKIGLLDYMGIDFGRKAVFLDPERKGAMALFGKNIKLDVRKVVVAARDISYISPEQYAAIRRPQSIQGFPAALMDPGLEYSGIFEDGWISDAAYVVLQAPLSSAAMSLHISGIVPDIGGNPFSPVITIKVNDLLVYSAKHDKGVVDITVPLDTTLFKDNPIAKVQIESSALQRLPNGDNRPISMHLNMIELKQQ